MNRSLIARTINNMSFDTIIESKWVGNPDYTLAPSIESNMFAIRRLENQYKDSWVELAFDRAMTNSPQDDMSCDAVTNKYIEALGDVIDNIDELLAIIETEYCQYLANQSKTPINCDVAKKLSFGTQGVGNIIDSLNDIKKALKSYNPPQENEEKSNTSDLDFRNAYNKRRVLVFQNKSPYGMSPVEPTVIKYQNVTMNNDTYDKVLSQSHLSKERQLEMECNASSEIVKAKLQKAIYMYDTLYAFYEKKIVPLNN